MKTSLDLDGVICDFYTAYINRFGVPKRSCDISKKVNGVLRKDKDFWLSLPVINKPNFQVGQYTTARSIPKTWIRTYLTNNGMPDAPIYQLYSHCISKVPKIKMGGCQLHIDDSLAVFMDCNMNGIPCLLMDSPSNRAWKYEGRIYSLDRGEIDRCYSAFMNQVFFNFKKYWNETVNRNPSILKD